MIAVGLFLTACQPWYTRHGFDNEAQLREPQSQAKLVEIVRAGPTGDGYQAALILASADASVTAPIMAPLFEALAQECQYVYHDDEHQGAMTAGCLPLFQAAKRHGASAAPEVAKLNSLAAVLTLGELGRDGRVGVHVVVAALGSPHVMIRGEAADALRKIGYPGPDVMKGLDSLTQVEPDPRVREAAGRSHRTLLAIAETGPVDTTMPNPNKTATAQPYTGGTSGQARPDDIALVIGIEKYRGTLPPSSAALSDARFFADVAENMLGVARRNIILLTDDGATKSSLDAYLSDWLPKNVKPGSRVYFFFAGHGAPDPETGKGYLVPWDADPRFIARQGIEVDAVAAQLQQLGVAQVIMMVDACFSGSGGRSVLAPGTRPLVPVKELKAIATGPTKFALLAAAGANEVTGTTADGKHGLFSYFLFEALQGKADLNQDGDVTLSEIANYLGRHVPDEARRDNREQTPRYQFSSDAVGDLAVVTP